MYFLFYSNLRYLNFSIVYQRHPIPRFSLSFQLTTLNLPWLFNIYVAPFILPAENFFLSPLSIYPKSNFQFSIRPYISYQNHPCNFRISLCGEPHVFHQTIFLHFFQICISRKIMIGNLMACFVTHPHLVL